MLLLLLLLLAAVVVAAARIDIAAAAAAGGVCVRLLVRLLSAVSFAAVGGANCGCFFYLTRLPRV